MVSDRAPGTAVLDPPEVPELAGLGKAEISYQIVIETKLFPTGVLEPRFWTPRRGLIWPGSEKWRSHTNL